MFQYDNNKKKVKNFKAYITETSKEVQASDQQQEKTGNKRKKMNVHVHVLSKEEKGSKRI